MSEAVKSDKTPTELQQLESLERDLYTRLRESEKRLAAEEAEYLKLSMQSPSAPSFGNLVSGWEGLLEGKVPCKKRGVERIFTGAQARH
jgi:hypothetical protein